MKSVYSVFFTLFLSVIASVPATGNDGKFEPARLIENNNRTKETNSRHGGMEGWAIVNYLIEEDGEVSEPIVLDYSGRSRFAKNGRYFVKNLQYAPATLNGDPVVSHNTLFVTHSINSAKKYMFDLGKPFRREYEKVLDAIKGQNFKVAADTLEDLEDDFTKGLPHHARLAWLKSIFYYQTRNFDEYYRNSRLAYEFAGKHLDAKMRTRSYVNHFENSLYRMRFFEGLEAILKMRSDSSFLLTKSDVDKMETRLFERWENLNEVAVEHQIVEGRVFSYQALFDQVTLNLKSGEIEQIDFRCTGKDAISKQVKNDDFPLTLKVDSLNCLLLVEAEDKAHISILDRKI